MICFRGCYGEKVDFLKTPVCRHQKEKKKCSISSSCKFDPCFTASLTWTLWTTQLWLRVKNLKPEQFWKPGLRLPGPIQPWSRSMRQFRLVLIYLLLVMTGKYYTQGRGQLPVDLPISPAFLIGRCGPPHKGMQCQPCSLVADWGFSIWAKNLGQQQSWRTTHWRAAQTQLLSLSIQVHKISFVQMLVQKKKKLLWSPRFPYRSLDLMW